MAQITVDMSTLEANVDGIDKGVGKLVGLTPYVVVLKMKGSRSTHRETTSVTPVRYLVGAVARVEVQHKVEITLQEPFLQWLEIPVRGEAQATIRVRCATCGKDIPFDRVEVRPTGALVCASCNAEILGA